MTSHTIGTRETWLAARRELLEAEKALTRQSDALAERRRALPWVKIDKDYAFDTEGGRASLDDLFGGRSQLLVYHFMFGPDYKAGCPSCSSIADGFEGITVHLQNHDVAFTAVSRAPLAQLLAYRERMGWTFDWASSAGSDFNADFMVWMSPQMQREGTGVYNYRREGPMPEETEAAPDAEARALRGEAGPAAQMAAMSGTTFQAYIRERPGVSAFARRDGAIYHTYSTYARGLDSLWGVYAWLDRAPLGRNEDGVWWRRHDEYAA